MKKLVKSAIKRIVSFPRQPMDNQRNHPNNIDFDFFSVQLSFYCENSTAMIGLNVTRRTFTHGQQVYTRGAHGIAPVRSFPRALTSSLVELPPRTQGEARNKTCVRVNARVA
ncbi:hypothetical protein KM043_011151 [Ampulex compressa]|nr:hypothetical protein KM043_011151 [Ampulex compressa]